MRHGRIFLSLRREFAASLIAGWAVIALAGCGGSPPPAGPRTLKIGAVLPQFSHPFFIAQKAGLEDAARSLGIEIDVRDGKDDDLKQIAQVETLINLKRDVIVLCPRDEAALVRSVEAANRAGIPVLTLNRRVQGGTVFTHVGADDAAGGRAQARALFQALGPRGGSIVYLQGTQGSSPQRSRDDGFRAELKTHPEIIIADDRFADFQADKAKAVMTVIAQRHQPGEIRAIVAQNDEMALPAAQVARSAGWSDVIVIGLDGTKGAFDAIRAGTLYATVLQDAADQGRRAVRAALDHAAGKAVPREIVTPLPVITKDNVDRFQPSY